MKKTTKLATNFSFPVSKGALLPFDTLNLKFIAFFVVFFALLTIPATKISASIIYENFNSYNAEAYLKGQGGWLGDDNGIYVREDENCFEGKCAEQTSLEHLAWKSFASSTSGSIIGYFRLKHYASNNYFVKYANYGNIQVLGSFIKKTNGEITLTYAGGVDTLAGTTIDDVWFGLTCEYKDLDDPVEANRQIRCKIDNNAFSEWRRNQQSVDNFGGIILFLNQPLDRADYFSDMAGYTEFSPIFSPSFPVDCEFTITSTTTLDNFNATGTITIPALNIFHWFDFSVVAEDFNTSEKHYFSTSTDLDGGDIFNYSIPISLPGGAWKISYLLQGVYFETSFFATHWCEHTGIGTGLPLPTWTEITEAEFLGLEDCSGMPLLERLVCDLKNAVKKIFVPSAESMTALKTTIEGLKNKAPMSYITITKDFFDDVKADINSSEDLTFKILNKTGNVSFAFWDSTTNLAGENQSLKEIFRRFFVFLIILCFSIWAIFYVRKIFK